MSVTWEEDRLAESCPACEAELATVRLRTEMGEVWIGPKCSRLLEALAKLCGLNPRRRRALRVA